MGRSTGVFSTDYRRHFSVVGSAVRAVVRACGQAVKRESGAPRLQKSPAPRSHLSVLKWVPISGFRRTLRGVISASGHETRQTAHYGTETTLTIQMLNGWPSDLAQLPLFFTKRQWAMLRGVSEKTIERELGDGTGAPFVRLGRKTLFRREAALGWLREHEVASTAEARRNARQRENAA